MTLGLSFDSERSSVVQPADSIRAGKNGVQEHPQSRAMQNINPWAHFIAGGTAGMTSAVLTSPLDVVKTRLQSDFYGNYIQNQRASLQIDMGKLGLGRRSVRHVLETCHILTDVYRLEGWRALFKGLGPNIVGVVPARAINFAAYGNGKRWIADHFNNGMEASWVHLYAAAFAGITTATLTNPIWLVKTRLQLDRQHASNSGMSRQYQNSFDCISKVVRKEGIRSLYRGLSASYLGVTESTLQWILYERMKLGLANRAARRRKLSNQETRLDRTLDWGGKLGAAGGAKLFATVVTYPHEVVRTRLREKPLSDGRPKYTGLLNCFRTIWVEEGAHALYGGMVPHMMRVVPSAAIMFGMYEMVLRLWETNASVE